MGYTTIITGHWTPALLQGDAKELETDGVGAAGARHVPHLAVRLPLHRVAAAAAVAAPLRRLKRLDHPASLIGMKGTRPTRPVGGNRGPGDDGKGCVAAAQSGSGGSRQIAPGRNNENGRSHARIPDFSHEATSARPRWNVKFPGNLSTGFAREHAHVDTFAATEYRYARIPQRLLTANCFLQNHLEFVNISKRASLQWKSPCTVATTRPTAMLVHSWNILEIRIGVAGDPDGKLRIERRKNLTKSSGRADIGPSWLRALVADVMAGLQNSDGPGAFPTPYNTARATFGRRQRGRRDCSGEGGCCCSGGSGAGAARGTGAGGASGGSFAGSSGDYGFP
eukprot:gene2735-biopygen13380